MNGSKAQSVQDKHWYLAVGDRSIGPLTTDLVSRGIQSGKVPLTAWICQVGAASWSALSSHDDFQGILQQVLASRAPANQQIEVRSGRVPPMGDQVGMPSSVPPASSASEPLPSFADEPSDSEVITSAPGIFAEHVPSAALTGQLGRPEPTRANEAQPGFAEESGEHDVSAALRGGPWKDPVGADDTQGPVSRLVRAEPEGSASTATADDGTFPDELGIDITFDEDDSSSIDWNERFQSYFLVGTEVELPEELYLLRSLAEVPRSTFQHDEALWNLALCMAFGSDRVAAVSASAFFESFDSVDALERIEWICRTLLSRGFMPSGIPRHAGLRGIGALRAACPPALRAVLEGESRD